MMILRPNDGLSILNVARIKLKHLINGVKLVEEKTRHAGYSYTIFSFSAP